MFHKYTTHHSRPGTSWCQGKFWSVFTELGSAGCWFVGILFLIVCPKGCEAGLDTFTGFLMGGTGAYPLVNQAGVFALWWAGLHQAARLEVPWAQEVYKQPVCWWMKLCTSHIGCLAWDISAMEPIGCWVGPSLNAKMVASRKAHKWIFFSTSTTSVLVPALGHSCPHLPMRPSKTSWHAWPGAPIKSLLLSWYAWNLACTLSRVGFCFPSPMEHLHSSSH